MILFYSQSIVGEVLTKQKNFLFFFFKKKEKCRSSFGNKSGRISPTSHTDMRQIIDEKPDRSNFFGPFQVV